MFAQISIRDVVKQANAFIGKKTEFDSQDRIVIDGRQTGNFLGRKGERDYIATTSGTEPIKGNKINVAAEILGCNRTEAVAWLRKTFDVAPPATFVNRFDLDNLPFQTFSKTALEAKFYLDKLDPASIFSYGYAPLDNHLGGIYRGEVVLIGGETGTGKTTFMTSILLHNAIHRPVLLFSLEDSLLEHGLKQLYFKIGKIRKKRDLKNYPWVNFRNHQIRSENYENDCAEALQILQSDNFLFFNRAHEKAPAKLDIDVLEELVKAAVEKHNVRLIGIDHLHFFDNSLSNEAKANRIETIMQRIKTLAEKFDVAILLLAHYRKLFGEKPTLDSFKDSISIVQTASVVINMWRDRSSDETQNMADDLEGKKGQRIYETHFFLPKIRNPVGEATIVMQFNPFTFDYQPLETHVGTQQELSFKKKSEIIHPDHSSF